MLLSCAGWVLVGGQSRRMGSDKAFLKIDAQPLAVHAAALLRPFTGRVTLVGDPEKYKTLQLPVIADRRLGSGPLAGIETVLIATEADWNLVVACDVPGLTEDILQALINQVEEGIEAIVPRHADGKLEPLCALYHRSALPKIQAALDKGTRRVTDALGLLTLRYLQVPDPRPFQNLNTPDDLDRYRHG